MKLNTVTDGDTTENQFDDTELLEKIDSVREKIVRGTKIRMIEDYFVWGDNTNGLIGTIHSEYEIHGMTRYITKFPNGEFGEITTDMFEVVNES